MVTAIGSTGMQSALNAVRNQAANKADAVKSTQTREINSAVSTEVARMVTSGAPIDVEKVEAIRTALNNGTYKIDPQAIANKMITSDLPAVSTAAPTQPSAPSLTVSGNR